MTHVRVLVVDDALAIRRVLADLLTADPRVECVGAAATVHGALDLARRTRPDVALMDVRMPGGGPVAVGAMRIASPGTRVVALSGGADGAIVRGMLDAGASGYLVKGTIASDLIDAVVRCAAGDTVLATEVAAAATAEPASVRPMLAILDGTVTDASQAQIPATDDGFLRGDGVFEVMRLYGGRPFALDDHLTRLGRSAANLRLPIDLDAVRADVEALLERNDVQEAAMRVVVTRGGRRLAIVEELKPLPETLALATIEYAPTRVLDQVKSLSYAANMLARRLAQEQGADDALLVTPHGRVLEGPTTSFVCSLDGETLVTPPLSEHILDSITRRHLFDVIEVTEQVIARDDLPRVREAFMASTLREVHPVRTIDGVALAAAPGALTHEAAGRIRAHIEQELGVSA